MKSLVVYYSLEGNTKYVAEEIAKQTGADILSLEPKKSYPTGATTKYIFGGRSAIMGDCPELKPYHIQLEEYNQIIFGTPVWASTFTPPLRTFIKQENLAGKKIAIFACSAGGKAEKCMEKLEKELSIERTANIPKLSLIEPDKNRTEENQKKISAFCKALS